MPRQKVQKRALKRAVRVSSGAAKRSDAAKRGSETARANRRAPSRRFIAWRRKDPAEWNARDAVGCYLAAYLSEYEEEDLSLKTKRDLSLASTRMRRLLDSMNIDRGERPDDFIRWAVAHCRRGSGWPSDRTCSVGTLTHDLILLKRWRSRGRRETAGRAVRVSSNRTFREA